MKNKPRILSIPEFPGYAVTDGGRVWSAKSNKWLKPCLLKYGGNRRAKSWYLDVRFWRDGKLYHRLVHRLVAAAFIGLCPAGLQVSHIDGDCLNNRLENLEYTTPKKNCNMPHFKRRNSAANHIGANGFRGVCPRGIRWRARIGISGKNIHLGMFDTPRAAAVAWDVYVRKHKLNRVTNKEMGLL